MRYWVYINDKVEGPFEEDKLVTLPGFTPDTLICAEEVAAGGSQEWVKASSIFEFDPVEQTINQPLPAAETFRTQAQPVQQANTPDAANLLLEKIDLLTQGLSSLQTKLDEMQNKLDVAIASIQKVQAPTEKFPSYIPTSDSVQNTITLTRQALETIRKEEPLPDTEHLVSQAEDMVTADNQEKKPLDMLGPIDLGEEKKQDQTPMEVSLGSKAEEEVVLRSALDSLYNAKAIQSQEEKESTFQDLLTPKQAEALASQAEAARANKKETSKPSLDDTLKTTEKAETAEPAKTEENNSKQETPSVEDAAKDALLKELTSEPKEDILDQVIKEKEEEQKAETFKMEQAAAAGAAAAVAAEQMVQEHESAQPEPPEAPGFETVQEAATEPVEEKQTLDFTQKQQEPPLTIAPDRTEPEKQEEVQPASQMPADQPAEQSVESQPAAPARPKEAKTDLPTLEQNDSNTTENVTANEETEEGPQELLPGAKVEKPDGIIITDADLNEAFAEHNKESDQSVEQLFGIASPTASAQPTPEQHSAQSEENLHLPEFSDQIADKPLPADNPNDLTEIELKEGSTYLISDFVPPAQANANALPNELKELQNQKAAAPKHNENSTAENTSPEIQEMVMPIKQEEKTPAPQDGALKDVTISQVILENTIKTKRGATLDIKTVPMVPEPAQSDRLHLDNMDDINTQHDMKEADVKTPAKTTRMLMGAGAVVVLAAVIYFMLAFMNLIPAQFNVLSSGQKTAAPQNAQIADEMLPQQAQPSAQPGTVPMEAAAANPMDNILTEVKNYPLQNGYTLQQFIEAKHPAAQNLITWEISTAVDPDNYSVLVKVPPENPQSFKISYRFNYNTVTKALDPTISDAKNLLDSVAQSMGALPQGQMQLPQQQGLPQQPAMPQQPMRP